MKPRVWAEEDYKNIQTLYESGHTIKYIAKEIFHCRESTISNIIKEKGYVKPVLSSRYFTLQDENTICELYQTGKYTQKFLAEKYSVCPEVIRNILRAHNIEIKKSVRKIDLELQEDYFSQIDSAEKAYLLGYLFADGNIYKNQLTLELHYKDIEILHLLQKELHSSNTISYRKRNNTEMCSCRICSEQIRKDLEKYGIVPDKTHQTKHLPEIPSLFLRDFLRGLLDGDGWITKDKQGYYHIGFVNNYESVCQEFQDRCNSLIEHKTKAKITNKGNNSGYVAQFQSKESVKQLAIALYKDSTCYLTRKYNLATDIFESKGNEDIV